MTSQRSTLARFFIGIWQFINGARKLALNLIFLLIMYFVVLAFWDTDETLIIQPDTSTFLMLKEYEFIEISVFNHTVGAELTTGPIYL